jgi:WD40 repeat protein
MAGDRKRRRDYQDLGYTVCLRGDPSSICALIRSAFRTAGIQRDYYHGSPVNDVVVHPNQGELISCDQNGSVKIWDLGENSCTHELVGSALIETPV